MIDLTHILNEVQPKLPGWCCPEKARTLAAIVMARRHALYQAAQAEHPERWSGGPTRNWEPAIEVLLNPGKPLKTEHQTEATTA